MVHLESAGSTGNLLRTFESSIKGQWKKAPVLAKFGSFYIPIFFLYSNFLATARGADTLAQATMAQVDFCPSRL